MSRALNATSPRSQQPDTHGRESGTLAGGSKALGALGAPADERTVRILAKSIHRDLSSNGWEAEDVMALASELLSSVASDMRNRRP